MEQILVVRNLTKRYKDSYALHGLNMQIPKGAIYGLIGKNGAGKTTLIRLICGLQQPTEGEYILNGIANTSNEIDLIRRKMGAFVETPSIYLDMTAKENILMQMRLQGCQNDSADEILSLLGLEDTGKKKAKTFSLGMRQRLGIAISLVGNPEFVILDEPVNGLDPQGIRDIRVLLQKLNAENNVTFLVSSHNLGELSKLATHYGFIDKGCMIKEITAKELNQECQTRHESLEDYFLRLVGGELHE